MISIRAPDEVLRGVTYAQAIGPLAECRRLKIRAVGPRRRGYRDAARGKHQRSAYRLMPAAAGKIKRRRRCTRGDAVSRDDEQRSREHTSCMTTYLRTLHQLFSSWRTARARDS